MRKLLLVRKVEFTAKLRYRRVNLHTQTQSRYNTVRHILIASKELHLRFDA